MYLGPKRNKASRHLVTDSSLSTTLRAVRSRLHASLQLDDLLCWIYTLSRDRPRSTHRPVRNQRPFSKAPLSFVACRHHHTATHATPSSSSSSYPKIEPRDSIVLTVCCVVDKKNNSSGIVSVRFADFGWRPHVYSRHSFDQAKRDTEQGGDRRRRRRRRL